MLCPLNLSLVSTKQVYYDSVIVFPFNGKLKLCSNVVFGQQRLFTWCSSHVGQTLSDCECMQFLCLWRGHHKS